MDRGLTQKHMSEKMNITQSHYSKIESGEYDPTKFIPLLSEIFGCKENEVFSGQILKDLETDFLNDPIRETQCIYHQRNPTKVYCKLEGWFTEEELRQWVEFSVSGIGNDNGN